MRSRVAPGHCVDEVVPAAVGASGGAGDVGFPAASVVADRGVAEVSHDGGSVAGPGLVKIFTERDIADVVDEIFDQLLAADPFLRVARVGVGGG